jgi:hypothetical protein
MKLPPRAFLAMRFIDQAAELEETPQGTTGMRRKFKVAPRSRLTWPAAWFITQCFPRKAIAAHNRAVEKDLTRKRST